MKGQETPPRDLTAEEIARRYDLPLYLVRKVSKKLRNRSAQGATKEGRPQRYSPAATQAIRKQVEKAQARIELRSTDEAAVFWQELAAVGDSAGQLARLSRELEELAAELKTHFKRLRRSTPTTTGWIYTLPDPALVLPQPLAVLIRPLRKAFWRASLPEAGLTGVGRSQEEAVLELRETIYREYLKLRESPSPEDERWRVLSRLIRRSRISGRHK